MSDTAGGNYLDPVVAKFTGDNADLLATIAESEGALEEYANSSPEQGPVGPSESDLAANEADALAAAQQRVADTAQESQGAVEEAATATEQLGSEAERASVGVEDMSARFESFANEERDAQAAAAQEAQYLSDLSAQFGAVSASSKDAENATKDAGDAAKTASVNWMALGIAAGVAEFGIGAGVLGMSAAIVGAGYLIADFGGEAKGDLQQVEDAFRSTATQAAAVFQPALQQITQTLTGMAQEVEPEMAQMFQALSGPAESFFQGLAVSAEDGMSALVPAIQQMGPLIGSITGDLDPLLTGIAGFVQQMAAAFEAGGGQQELAQLAQEIGQLLPVVGELTGEVGAGLLPIMEALTPILTAAGNVLNALGPQGDTAVAAVLLLVQGMRLLQPVVGLLDQGITLVAEATANYTADLAAQADVAQIAAAGNEGLAVETEAAAAAAETAGPVYEQLAIEFEMEGVAAEGAGAETAAAAVEIEAAGVAADEAAFSIGALALELLPWVAAAAVAGFAAEELVNHWQTVANFFEQLGSDMFSFGENLVDGLAQGIESAWQTVLAPVENLINGVKGAFTSMLGINSPSTVAMGYGQDTGEGYALGLEGVTGRVTGASAALAASAAAGLGTASAAVPAGGSAGSGSQGGTTVQVTMNFANVPFSVASASEIEQLLLPVLQQLDIRNGTNMTTLATTGGRG